MSARYSCSAMYRSSASLMICDSDSPRRLAMASARPHLSVGTRTALRGVGTLLRHSDGRDPREGRESEAPLADHWLHLLGCLALRGVVPGALFEFDRGHREGSEKAA